MKLVFMVWVYIIWRFCLLVIMGMILMSVIEGMVIVFHMPSSNRTGKKTVKQDHNDQRPNDFWQTNNLQMKY
ncbi:MAG TPA: hypothetical protein DCR51_03560 [Idiomarina loihiensis]|nr:hypothetical protein [Idiomarina loihiensis]